MSTVTGFADFLANVQALQASVPVTVHDIVEQATAYGLTVTCDSTPVVTGYLQSRNQMEEAPESTTTIIVYTLFNDADYADYVCFGTRFQDAQDFLTPGIDAANGALLRGLQGML